MNTVGNMYTYLVGKIDGTYVVALLGYSGLIYLWILLTAISLAFFLCRRAFQGRFLPHAPLWWRLAHELPSLLMVVILFGTTSTMYAVSMIEMAHHFVVNQEKIKEEFSDPFMIPAAIFLGGFLFGLKCRARFFYGAIEGMVGTIAITYAVLAPAANLIALILPLASGIYILVRSLDNMNEALKTKERWKDFSINFKSD